MSVTASFVCVAPDGRYQFHDGDGSEHVVTADKPYSTDDARVIAELDNSPFVTRADKKKAA